MRPKLLGTYCIPRNVGLSQRKVRPRTGHRNLTKPNQIELAGWLTGAVLTFRGVLVRVCENGARARAFRLNFYRHHHQQPLPIGKVPSYLPSTRLLTGGNP